MTQERRRHPRVSLSVSLACAGYRGTGTFFLDLHDVSEGGAFIETSFPLKIGCKVHLLLPLGMGKSEHVEGRVVRVDPPRSKRSERDHAGVAIKFEHLPHKARTRIQRFVAENTQEQETDSIHVPVEQGFAFGATCWEASGETVLEQHTESENRNAWESAELRAEVSNEPARDGNPCRKCGTRRSKLDRLRSEFVEIKRKRIQKKIKAVFRGLDRRDRGSSSDPGPAS
jgi:Tfp pilus assembly protein PilZ